MSSTDERSRPFGRRDDLPRITIVHGDRVRAFHVDTRRLVAGAIVAGAFCLSYLAASGWLWLRDDVLADQPSREVRMERIYEDRIAALRAEIDRINGRQLVDQDAFEAKIDDLLTRQAKLGEAQAKLGGLVAKVGDLGIALPSGKGPGLTPLGAPSPTPSEPEAVPPKPFDAEGFATPLRSSWLSPFSTRAHAAETRGDPSARIAAAERSIVAFEKQQGAVAAGLADVAESRGRSWSRALAKIGFRVAEPPHPAPRPTMEAVGGPFVPARLDAFGRAENALGRLASLRAAAKRLPLARPLDGERAITSDFGVRMDPFLGVGAMHTGLDFRAEVGDPVHATGPGVVVGAGRQGGYGLCVDVDHGNGVVTRYGHLSSISVAVGAKISAGDRLGLAGSTGRSTGPHLHYETRVSGEPVDPRDWLEAGRTLGF